ncbi:hypothetical protein GmRootV15_68780 (plasmid) [Variovorax sp. V15]
MRRPLICINNESEGSGDARGMPSPSSASSSSLFDQLLLAAAAQPEPQRLLFVFAEAELPGDADAAQRARFEAGQGGALTPVACVEKSVPELTTFAALVAESRRASLPWRVMFAAGLPGANGRPPSPERIDSALQAMVENVRSGAFGGYLALDTEGRPVQFG